MFWIFSVFGGTGGKASPTISSYVQGRTGPTESCRIPSVGQRRSYGETPVRPRRARRRFRCGVGGIGGLGVGFRGARLSLEGSPTLGKPANGLRRGAVGIELSGWPSNHQPENRSKLLVMRTKRAFILSGFSRPPSPVRKARMTLPSCALTVLSRLIPLQLYEKNHSQNTRDHPNNHIPWPRIGKPRELVGNGHFYDVVSVPGTISWEDANAAAVDAGGYLATVTFQAENYFVFLLVNNATYWHGSSGPWLGGISPLPPTCRTPIGTGSPERLGTTPTGRPANPTTPAAKPRTNCILASHHLYPPGTTLCLLTPPRPIGQSLMS